MDPDMIRPRRSKPCPPPTPLEDSLPPPISPPLWLCHWPPRPPSHVRNYYWNDNLDRFSRMQRGESLDVGYRMNYHDFHEDHTLRHCMALHPPGPPPMLMGHHRGQPSPLLGHQGEPPTSCFPPRGDYGYQHSYENPNGCTIM